MQKAEAVVFSSAGRKQADSPWAKAGGATRMPLKALLRRRVLPRLSVVGVDDVDDGLKVSPRLGLMQLSSPDSFVVVSVVDTKNELDTASRQRLLESFPDLQRVEITTRTKSLADVRDLIQSVEAKLAILAQRRSPRPSPLDEVARETGITAHLRAGSGNLSAEKVAHFYGLSVKALAELLGRTRQAVSKTPDADSLQAPLEYFERIARLRSVLRDDASFRKWLRMPNQRLNGERPLDWIREGRWQNLADLVDDILTGAPS
jgi:hypothetical protein